MHVYIMFIHIHFDNFTTCVPPSSPTYLTKVKACIYSYHVILAHTFISITFYIAHFPFFSFTQFCIFCMNCHNLISFPFSYPGGGGGFGRGGGRGGGFGRGGGGGFGRGGGGRGGGFGRGGGGGFRKR